MCGKIEGIGFVQFGEKDVVRHNLVQQIIRAYEEYDVVHPQRGGNGKAAAPARESGAEEQRNAAGMNVSKNARKVVERKRPRGGEQRRRRHSAARPRQTFLLEVREELGLTEAV